MITTVQIELYETEDGKRFQTREEAESYERRQMIINNAIKAIHEAAKIAPDEEAAYDDYKDYGDSNITWSELDNMIRALWE